MKKLKLMLTTFICILSVVLLSSCNDAENTPEPYPYQDYFEEEIFFDYNKIYKKIGDATNGFVSLEDNNLYSAIVFKAKEGIKINSVTFTMKAKQDCQVVPFLRLNSTELNGFPQLCLDINDRKKIYELKANEEKTFTFGDMFRNANGDYKCGQFPVGTKEDNKKVVLNFLIPSDQEGLYYLLNSNKKIYSDCNIQIGNVVFDVEKLQEG